MFKNILASLVKWGLLLAAFAVLVGLNWLVWEKHQANQQTVVQLQQELVNQQRENAQMTATNADLRRRIDSLKRGGNDMIEEEARNSFGMVGEGETFYDFHIEPSQ